jgi:hypothetical protein
MATGTEEDAMFNQSLQVLRKWKFFAVVCAGVLGVSASSAPAQAEPTFQADLERQCAPAMPQRQELLSWKPARLCTGDCFVWRLTCSNGKQVDLQANIHPDTTEWQFRFWAAAPGSVVVYLLVFAVLIAVGSFGWQFAVPVVIFNVFFMLYVTAAVAALLASITGDPFGDGAEFQRHFFNQSVYTAVVLVGALINLVPVWRELESLFYRHPINNAVVQVDWSDQGAQAIAAALMPNLYEFVDPGESAAYYRRETERLRALKDKFDADTALAKSIIRYERARTLLNDQT